MLSHALRPYQASVIARVRAAWCAGARRILIVAPTGAGKTLIACALADGAVNRKGRRALWLCHRRELVDQASASLTRVGVPHGVILAGRRPMPGAPFQVASVQTLTAKGEAPEADIVFVDEAHHATAGTWQAIVDAYPNVEAVFGLTATPERGDRTPLGDVFQHLEVACSVKQLQLDGHLVRATLIAPSKRLKALAMDPVVAYQKHLKGRRALVFSATVDEARDLVAAFATVGVRAACVEGTTDPRKRAAALEGLASGALDVVTNVFCLDAETELLTPHGWVKHYELLDGENVAQWDDGGISFVPPSNVVVRRRAPGERMVVLDSIRRSVRVTEDHRMLVRTSRRGPFTCEIARHIVRRSLFVPISGRLARAPLIPDPEQPPQQNRARLLASMRYELRSRGLTADSARIEAARRVDRTISLRHKLPEELTSAECSLIGFWLGDGSVAKLKKGGREYTLVQSGEDLGVVAWIDRTIAACGLDSVKREHYAGSKSHRWSLPRGTGGGPQQRRGVFALEPYLVKGGTPLLWRLSRDNFDALLHGFWMAEGNHGPDGTKPKAYYAVNTNKRLLDLLQALAVCHGYRATIFNTSLPHGNSSHCYGISWRPDASTHQTSKAGAWFDFEPGWRDEIVWCATVPSGFLVTRRRGTVTVVGNCLTEGTDIPAIEGVIVARGCSAWSTWVQMIGRGLRPSPSTGKRACIVVDLRGVVHEHGLPDDERAFSLTGVASKEVEQLPSLTQCRACGATFRAGPRTCPACGELAPPVKRARVAPASMGEVGRTVVVASSAQQFEAFAALERTRRAKGYAPKWTGVQFMHRFGFWPRFRADQVSLSQVTG